MHEHLGKIERGSIPNQPLDLGDVRQAPRHVLKPALVHLLELNVGDVRITVRQLFDEVVVLSEPGAIDLPYISDVEASNTRLRRSTASASTVSVVPMLVRIVWTGCSTTRRTPTAAAR